MPTLSLTENGLFQVQGIGTVEAVIIACPFESVMWLASRREKVRNRLSGEWSDPAGDQKIVVKGDICLRVFPEIIPVHGDSA
jgi:hypothetical protein